jgi:hypothetical protein
MAATDASPVFDQAFARLQSLATSMPLPKTSRSGAQSYNTFHRAALIAVESHMKQMPAMPSTGATVLCLYFACRKNP